MSETSKLKKYLMWYKIKKLSSEKLNDSQIHDILGIHRQTVAKYRNMTEDEFLSSQSYCRTYHHKLDRYEQFIVNELRRWPFLSAPQIHDRLKENFPDLPTITEKTVFNFVCCVRQRHDIPKKSEKSFRPYECQPPSPYGRDAQVDFGERFMTTVDGKSVKVYFFAMSLSRSRYKYIYFSKTPFTTALAVYAHELAFEFFGGVPQKITYDQDKVFLNDENMGDLLLTKKFKAFVQECGFETHFCRKSDPESKGKIENVVKYVKYNFLRGREFSDIERLNKDALSWLDRTGNGTIHHGIHKIPSEEFAIEKSHLMEYHGVPTPPMETLAPHHVRKDNVINFRGNFYAVPTGTYKGPGTKVYLQELNGLLTLFSADTGKILVTHPLSSDKGKLITNTSLARDRETSLTEYIIQARNHLPQDQVVDVYLAEMRKDKSRHMRDNLKFILKRYWKYTGNTLVEAILKCHEAEVYNAKQLMEVAESIRINKKEPLLEEPTVITDLPTASTSNMIPEKTDITSFEKLFA